MSAAGASRRVRVQPAWRASASDAQARTFLQQRLSAYAGVLFVGLGVLNAFIWLLYREYDEIAPKQWRVIVGGSAVALAALGLIWRLVLARRTLSERALVRLDLMFAVSVGLILGAAGALSPERRASGYAVLAQTIFAVFARAFLVP